MSEFIEIKANENSILNRRLVYGFGVNDADYIVQPVINGKQVMCPYYRKWHSMLVRCYSAKLQELRPTYIGATVCKEWLTFSNFKGWMEGQYWEGLDLDKDIIKPRNKVYSPDVCCFVPKKLNTLLGDCEASRGCYPQGIDLKDGKYRVRCRYNGESKHLGSFKTIEAASLVYRKFKANLVSEIAAKQENKQIERGLMLHAAIILKGDSYE